jgi:hypothetical protein
MKAPVDRLVGAADRVGAAPAVAAPMVPGRRKRSCVMTFSGTAASGRRSDAPGSRKEVMVSTRSDLARSYIAISPAEPGGSAAPSVTPSPLSTSCLTNFLTSSPGDVTLLADKAIRIRRPEEAAGQKDPAHDPRTT